MDKKTAIRTAREAIGEGSRDDYIISPTKHAAELEKNAPDLSEILRSSEVETIALQYEDIDKRAIEAQSVFKQTVSRVNVAVFFSALIGVVLMVSAAVGKDLESNTIMDIWLIFLGITGVIFGALGHMWMARVRGGHMLERWMKERASAETMRLRYFELVTKPLEMVKEVSSIPLLLLQLEYFIRYQLEVQLAFYSRRGDDHRRIAEKTLKLAGWAVFLGSLGAGLGGVLGAFKQSLASIAALGMVGAALSSYAVNTEAVNQDRRNAERYRRTQETLLKLRARLDEIRKVVAAGRHEALELFVASVQEQLSLEHRQWISATSGISSTLSKLDEALASNQ